MIYEVKELLDLGVDISNPIGIAIDKSVQIDAGVIIEANVIIKGESKIGMGSLIGSFSYIESSIIENYVEVLSSRIVNSHLHNDSKVGPYSFIRGNSYIHNGVAIGSFAEINDSIIKKGSKCKHFSYIGHTEVGKNVNIGAGTITCTFDGKDKFRSIIENDAFVGSGTLIIAPILIEESSYIGAGSIITKNVMKGTLVYGQPARKISKIKL